jgi:hypothetical protein
MRGSTLRMLSIKRNAPKLDRALHIAHNSS